MTEGAPQPQPQPQPSAAAAAGGDEGPDSELERLKARRLAEMRTRALAMEAGAGQESGGEGAGGERGGAPSPREALVSALGHRGVEVLEAAERQYPAQAPRIVDELGRMAIYGQLPGGLDGGGLLSVFRSLGINVRLNTRITVEQDGRMVSLSDRLGRGGAPAGG